MRFIDASAHEYAINQLVRYTLIAYIRSVTMKKRTPYLLILMLALLVVSLSGCIQCNEMEEPSGDRNAVEQSDKSLIQDEESAVEGHDRGDKGDPIEITDDEDDEDDNDRKMVSEK